MIDVSSWISTLFVVMQGSRRNILPIKSIPQLMVNTIVQILNLFVISFKGYAQINLSVIATCRAVISQFFRI